MAEGKVQLRPYRTSGMASMVSLFNTGMDQKDKSGSGKNAGRLHAWESSASLAGKIIPFVAIVLFMGFIFVTPSTSSGTFCLFPVIFIVILLGMWWVWNMYINSRMGAPVMLANASVVRRDDSLDVLYRQGVRRETEFTKITLQLILREWVRYSCGTKTCTDTYNHVLQSETFSGERVRGGEAIELHTTFHIPEDAMHSFEAGDNRLTWLVGVKLAIKDFPDLEEVFEIEVAPEMTV